MVITSVLRDLLALYIIFLTLYLSRTPIIIEFWEIILTYIFVRTTVASLGFQSTGATIRFMQSKPLNFQSRKCILPELQVIFVQIDGCQNPSFKNRRVP